MGPRSFPSLLIPLGRNVAPEEALFHIHLRTSPAHLPQRGPPRVVEVAEDLARVADLVFCTPGNPAVVAVNFEDCTTEINKLLLGRGSHDRRRGDQRVVFLARPCASAHLRRPLDRQKKGKKPATYNKLRTKTIYYVGFIGGAIGVGNAHPLLQASGAIAGPAPPCASLRATWNLSCSSVRTARVSR